MDFRFKLIITALSLLIYQLIEKSLAEYIISFGLILFIGIPHGATDLLLEQLKTGRSKESTLDKVFFMKYFSIMTVYGICWYLSPTLSFTIFLALSAYHFGEAQIAYTKNQKVPFITYALLGSGILCLILFPHQEELKDYTTPYFLSKQTIIFISNQIIWLLLTTVGIALLLISINNLKNLPKEILDLIMILLISYGTSLLFGFAIFFTFWHSWDAVNTQIEKIKQLRPDFKFSDWIKAASPFTFLSWAGIALAIIGFQIIDLPWPMITSFFVLVAIITLPHAIVMSRFYKTDYSILK